MTPPVESPPAIVAPARAELKSCLVRVEGAPADQADALRARVEEAFVFALKENGWSAPGAISAEALEVVVTELPKGTMASASGPRRFSVSPAALGKQDLDGVFAHEITHVQDFRAAGAGLGKLPRYLEEGRGFFVGRAFRALRQEPGDDAARAALLARLTAEEGAEAIRIFRDSAGNKVAKERRLASRFSAVGLFFIDRLRIEFPDALARLSRVWERVGTGTPFEDAFVAAFGKPLATFEAGFVEFLKKTEGDRTARLKGTAFESR